MGVGKYRTTALPSYEQAAEDYSAPAYNYQRPSAPPPGVSGNQFDQTAINWQMAQKYGEERARQNRDIQQSYNQRYNDWLANSQRGVQPNSPALFETNPNALYSYFNSSQPGLLLQNGRIADPGMGQMDPLEQMFALGAPGAAPVARAAGPGYQPQLPPMTPEQIAWASGGVQAPAPPASAPVINTNFGANLTPEQRARAAATGPQPAAPVPGYGPEAGGPPNRAATPAEEVNAPRASLPGQGPEAGGPPPRYPGYGPEAGGPPPRYPAAPAPPATPAPNSGAPDPWLSDMMAQQYYSRNPQYSPARRGFTLPPNEQRRNFQQTSPYVAPSGEQTPGTPYAASPGGQRGAPQGGRGVQYPSVTPRPRDYGNWGRRY